MRARLQSLIWHYRKGTIAARAGAVPDKSELNSDSEQKPKRKSKWDTTDEEKRDNLYNKVERLAFTGQKPTSQSLIDGAPREANQKADGSGSGARAPWDPYPKPAAYENW